MKSEQTSPVTDKYNVRNWGSHNKSLEASKEANQSTEIILKCKILNRFRQKGMPQAYKVA